MTCVGLTRPPRFGRVTAKVPTAARRLYFGDPGSTDNAASGERPSHTYANPGTYRVTLTVTDDSGLTDITDQLIAVTP
jgi:PKD repeat protein